MEGAQTSTLLIHGARQLVTVRGTKEPRRGADLGELHIITDGALLIRDGIIQEVGPSRRLENLAEARNAIVVNASGKVVIPGFIDSHTHLVFPGPGTSESDRAAALRHLHGGSANLLRRRVQRSLETMVRHGTTTAESKTGGSADITAETKILRVLGALRSTPLDLLPTFVCANAQRETMAGYESSLARVRRRSVGVAEWVWADRAADPDLFSRFCRTARTLGFGCKIHVSGGDTSRAIATAVDNQVLTIDHLEHASPHDAAVLARSGVIGTLLPAASFRCGGPYAPARAFIDAGAAVSLASDFSPHLSSTLSMQTVVSLACGHLGMTPAEALTAATFNAAHALGMAGTTGSLEPGKRADLVLLNSTDYRDLAHHLGTNLVHQTMKNGVFIYAEGQVSAPAGKNAA